MPLWSRVSYRGKWWDRSSKLTSWYSGTPAETTQVIRSAYPCLKKKQALWNGLSVMTKVLHQMHKLSQHSPAPSNQIAWTASPKLAAPSWNQEIWSSALTDPYQHLWDTSTFVLWGLLVAQELYPNKKNVQEQSGKKYSFIFRTWSVSLRKAVKISGVLCCSRLWCVFFLGYSLPKKRT